MSRPVLKWPQSDFKRDDKDTTLVYAEVETSGSLKEIGAMIRFIVCVSLSAVDGNTVRCDGQNLRDMGDAQFVSGYDTPDIGRSANCDRENALGETAKRLMTELLRTPGITIEDSGKLDQYDRPLVVLRLPDGRTIGSLMLAEGLAVHGRPGGDFDWCQ